MKNTRKVPILVCLCLLGLSSLLSACNKAEDYSTPASANGGYGGAGGVAGGIGAGETGGGVGGHSGSGR